MTPPRKKQRVSKAINDSAKASANQSEASDDFAFTPISAKDRIEWQGFCEIESEPAFFNVMLKDFGVKDIKVQEVFSLDEVSLAMLPQPVYGLIFLFRFRPEKLNNQEQSCPDHLWFANQTHDFACATVAMLNIVNNIPNADLGPNLQSFKEFTKDFTPALRGDQIGTYEFVKRIHNSFARKMDMLNIDLSLQNAYDDRRKKKAQAAPSEKKSKKVITEDDYIDDDSGFHFAAYVPVDDEIWKLDGVNRQPEKIGNIGTASWLEVVRPVLETRMAEYSEGQIEFNLLSLVRDPLLNIRGRMAETSKSLAKVVHRLDEIKPDWQSIAAKATPVENGDQNGDSAGQDLGLGVTAQLIEEAELPAEISTQLESDSAEKLMATHQQIMSDRASLVMQMNEELESVRDDQRRADERRHDYSPLIHMWLSMLAKKEGLVKELYDDIK